jgi:hypothetical protein
MCSFEVPKLYRGHYKATQGRKIRLCTLFVGLWQRHLNRAKTLVVNFFWDFKKTGSPKNLENYFWNLIQSPIILLEGIGKFLEHSMISSFW